MSFLIYTKPDCNFCVRAKELLEDKGLSYKEIAVLPFRVPESDNEIGREDLLLLFPGRTHLPIILKDGQVIGGFDKLKDHLKETNSG